MKYLIDKAAFDALEPSLQAFYKAQGENYVLAVEGLPAPQGEDVTGLKAKNDELLAELRANKTKAREAEEAARLANEEAARKNGDTEALDRSWNEKHTKALGEKDTALSTLQAQVHALTVGSTAARLAGELAVQGSSAILQQLIEPRLTMEIRDGRPVVVVLDNDRRPSALTVDEFKEQLFSDAALAPLIAASRATGGGAPGGKSPGGKSKLSDMSESERKQLAKDNPAEFDRLVEQARKKD